MSFDPTKYTKSKWIKGSDLEQGAQTVVTIKRAYEHTFEQDGETKPILAFNELDQQLVLNKTQIKTLMDVFGSDPAAWIGKRVMMMAVPSSFQGKPTILLQAARARPTPQPVFAGREYSDAEAPGDPQWDTPEPF